MLSTFTETQLKTADWLLTKSTGRPEGQIRSRIQSLLESLEIECEVDYRTPGASGSCDMYLPRRRTVIETKRLGLADQPDKPQPRESPKQQLERYLRDEINYELRSLDIDGHADRDWTGIVTDGRLWHVWKYQHSAIIQDTEVVNHFKPRLAEELVSSLSGFVAGELVGREWVPADISIVFEPLLLDLRDVFAKLDGEKRRNTDTKFSLWTEMMTTSSMIPEADAARTRLFVSHSFLVALARGVIHTLRYPKKTPAEQDVLGDGFVAWIVESHSGRSWAKDLFSEIARYEWRRRPGDVLRSLYEHIVGVEDRKAFGEFYTPDWLAELMVQAVCDDEWCRNSISQAAVANRKNHELKGVGVLDPACGSGTFLYHAARRLAAHSAMGSRSDGDKASIVCALVHGVDVHPVAAEIARATLLRALPALPPFGNESLRIYEGDALLATGSEDRNTLFQASASEIRIHTPSGRQVNLPLAFVERPEFADDLRRIVLSACDKNGMPDDVLEGLGASDREAVESCYKSLEEIIQREGNSVWTWYIWNVTGPYLLSKKTVNRIVANPPWVKMSNIQAPRRKQVLEQFAKQEGMNLWHGGKQAPHFDIAQLFVKRCRKLYLSEPASDKAAWEVKKAALKSGNWKKFRHWQASLLTQTLDLESLQPFGGGDARRSCVLFEQSSIEGFDSGRLVAESIEGRPEAGESLERAWQMVSVTQEPEKIEQDRSEFLDENDEPLFRQGATITPKVLSVVTRCGGGRKGRDVRVRTEASDKGAWKSIQRQEGEVSETWLRPLIASNSLLPFALRPNIEAEAIVPVDDQQRLSRVQEGTCTFWDGLDYIYREYKGKGRNTPKTLFDQLDYSSKLSNQLNKFAGGGGGRFAASIRRCHERIPSGSRPCCH